MPDNQKEILWYLDTLVREINTDLIKKIIYFYFKLIFYILYCFYNYLMTLCHIFLEIRILFKKCIHIFLKNCNLFSFIKYINQNNINNLIQKTIKFSIAKIRIYSYIAIFLFNFWRVRYSYRLYAIFSRFILYKGIFCVDAPTTHALLNLFFESRLFDKHPGEIN